eukprot:6188423-Pleurochrysis_carterae.AAC.2
MGSLGELLELAHVRAGRGKAIELSAFGLTLLALEACVAGGEGLPLQAGVELLRDVFKRLRVRAARRRIRRDEEPLDLGALVKDVSEKDYKMVQDVYLVTRVASAATQAA